MTQPIQVLNAGHVRLVEHMGSDLSIVRNARVSYDAEWRSGQDAGKDAKLIHYLWRNKHSSPFESVQFTFDIKCPIFVARQWHRHRTWAFNEVSARYTELPSEFYIPEVDKITTQSKSNKQMRTEEQHAEAKEIQWKIISACDAAFEVYRWLLEDGCPRELARGVLPMNTYTHFFGTVDLQPVPLPAAPAARTCAVRDSGVRRSNVETYHAHRAGCGRGVHGGFECLTGSRLV
jgi:thymidylate synthase (FAD)